MTAVIGPIHLRAVRQSARCEIQQGCIHLALESHDLEMVGVLGSCLRVSSVLASSQPGVFFQDPLKHDVSRGGPMDGFIAVSWKKTPGCGLAPPQVVQYLGDKGCWISQLDTIFQRIPPLKGCFQLSLYLRELAQYTLDLLVVRLVEAWR
jgi:hypothetical protein